MIRRELRLFVVALQFLTRFPVPTMRGYESQWLNDSARYFPLVGTLVGLIGAAVLWAAGWLFPAGAAVVLSMAAAVLATGAFHEDGLADTFDALGGAVSRERALEIMKDSRIGSYGAVALWMVLSLKAATLASLPVWLAMPALVLAHTSSRAAAVSLMRFLPYAGDVAQSKAKPMAQRISQASFVIACVWPVAVSMVMTACVPGWWSLVLASLMLSLVGAWCCAHWFMRRLGGITGDALGATQQLAELLILLGWLAWARI